ncbi:macrolide export protein MacA [Methylomusa anaerophila]|uniref:Macrolide export protein MacA n=1 Tax=Methylomusa anaerophila TaxID=1930071 RepID=A0A348AM72_9FIRM|nr:macrolide export protein MacA [Methylomusa anaerophila]
MVIAAAVIAGLSHLDRTKPVASVNTVPVKRADIAAVVSATGTINPVNMVSVSSKVTGLIKEVKVNENDRVAIGQVLITLDDTRTRAQVNQARAKLVNAEADCQRIERLAAAGAVAAQQLDAARMDYNVAQATYDDVVSQLDDTVIRAPIDGVVIGKPVPAGQTVAPGISTPMVLLTIADMSRMQIETQIDESDIGNVQVNQKAAFTVDGYPGKTFTGTVVNVSAKANIQQNVVYYPVIIDIDPDTAGNLLKPTMTARVSINIGESRNTLTIPLVALKDNQGQSYVQVMNNGQIKATNVTTGLMTDEQVEITGGLTEHQQVVVPQNRQPGAGGSSSMQSSPLQKVMGR